MYRRVPTVDIRYNGSLLMLELEELDDSSSSSEGMSLHSPKSKSFAVPSEDIPTLSASDHETPFPDNGYELVRLQYREHIEVFPDKKVEVVPPTQLCILEDLSYSLAPSLVSVATEFLPISPGQ
eukprot:CAMPEP_0116153818 /NCGR_PEP_ID=MMETSP0329-20121206/21448_1 /TAXON_ID=697910 /ORGANISM="Pseudo-nitzschia arenysensis, Strain B593" /LENGTH=123 /DNA_ID=CAMNT_0003650753 /DNA_START=408 /DNA_END=780 /DNA_ORIENTATION=+